MKMNALTLACLLLAREWNGNEWSIALCSRVLSWTHLSLSSVQMGTCGGPSLARVASAQVLVLVGRSSIPPGSKISGLAPTGFFPIK